MTIVAHQGAYSTKSGGPECTGKDRNSCLTETACYWGGNQCVEGVRETNSGASPIDVPTTPNNGSQGAPRDRTPVMYSCMVDGLTAPVEGVTWVDSVKAKSGMAGPSVETLARSTANVGTDATITCSIHVQPKQDSHEWLHRRMAPNCAPHFDLNGITTINHFQCKYSGTGVVDGKTVRRPSYQVNGRLPSCDGYNEYMEISDVVMESIKLYAYDKAGGKESQLDADQFVCDVQSLPLH